MRSEDDRRAHGSTRIPFDGLVELGGSAGSSFEAQAVDLSERGMHLRTAYLPEAGRKLSCRFDAGPGEMVLASGTVVWSRQEGKGGEFGVQFEELDPESAEALRRLLGAGNGVDSSSLAVGSRVRLHIDGLASPMRARVKSTEEDGLTVGSELAFLEIGKGLRLEDASDGSDRAATIDRVDVEVAGEARVPTLVVSLKFSDEAASVGIGAARAAAGRGLRPENEAAAVGAPETGGGSKPSDPEASVPIVVDHEAEPFDQASKGLRAALRQSAGKAAPVWSTFSRRVRRTVGLLMDRTRSVGATGEAPRPPRRTTAPAPGGGLHTSGRKVVRGEVSSPSVTESEVPVRTFLEKPKLIAGAAVLAAVLLGVIALRKPATTDTTATAPAVSSSSTLTAPAGSAPPATPGFTGPALSAGDGGAVVAPVAAVAQPAPGSAGETAGAGAAGATESALDTAVGEPRKARSPLKVAPFSNGPVAHGNVLRLKMDGPIERIQGASQPTGFTVVLPSRRSLEAAGPLAARDGRIATMHVTNEPSGAELTVTFKDGVPNYLVRAKGDVLEIVLAAVGPVADTRRPGKGTAPHGKPTESHPRHRHHRGHTKHP